MIYVIQKGIPFKGMIKMQQIQLSARFFKQELKNYANFASALFREFVQNSVEVDCKKAIIKIYDNGIGMSKDVLENCYLKLGETTKESTENIGGFGKARLLTTYSHDYWKITTQDCICEGSGGTYSIKDGQPFIKGCRMEIHILAEDKYENRIDMLAELKNFLSMCQIDCTILVNGEEYKEWLYKRKFTRSLEIGNVFVNKSGEHMNKVIMRVSGIMMFWKWTRANAQAVVEIDTQKSRVILLSNRDSLSQEYQNELDSFLSELAIDTNSALKSRFSRYTKRFGNAVKIHYLKSKLQKIEDSQKQAAFLHEDRFVGGEQPQVITKNNSSIETKHEENSGKAYDLNYNGFGAILDTPPEKFEESLVIHVDTEDTKLKRIAETFNPENWVEGGGKKKKLLNLWTIACQSVLDIWGETNEERISWITGFNFSEEQALHQTQDEVHCLLFKPVNKNFKMAYSVTDRDSWVELITLAAHEVCHINFSSHDEEYAAAFTSLMANILKKLPKIINAMKYA